MHAAYRVHSRAVWCVIVTTVPVWASIFFIVVFAWIYVGVYERAPWYMRRGNAVCGRIRCGRGGSVPTTSYSLLPCPCLRVVFPHLTSPYDRSRPPGPPSPERCTEAAPADSTTDRVCEPLSPSCLFPSLFELRPPTKTSDRICKVPRVCSTDEYQVVPLAMAQDRVCAKVTVCGPTQHETLAPSATENRKCQDNRVRSGKLFCHSSA